MATCPDAPARVWVVVGCTAAPSPTPRTSETATLPAAVPGSFGNDVERATFARDLARCRAEREVKDEVEKRFQRALAAASTKAASESRQEGEAAVAAATAGLTDRKAIGRARAQALADAKKAAAKKLKDARSAVTREDVAAVTAELAASHLKALSDDYDKAIDDIVRKQTLDVMQKRLDKARAGFLKKASAKPRAVRGSPPPPPKSADDIAAEVERQMIAVRCAQSEWGQDQMQKYSHGWAVGRREQVDFDTIAPKAAYLKDFKPTYAPGASDKVQIPAALQGSQNMPGVAPEVALFLTTLAADSNTPPFKADNYRGHGGGSWQDKGFSLDLYISAPHDIRGFWTHEPAVKFLMAIDATATKFDARWRVLYNDFRVMQEINQATGKRNVEFTGNLMGGKLNWHGPDPLKLHFHLDLEIAQGAQDKTAATPAGKAP